MVRRDNALCLELAQSQQRAADFQHFAQPRVQDV